MLLGLPICTVISIHAPREGGDKEERIILQTLLDISIHAPREGGDAAALDKMERKKDFNPRPPRGGRL